MFDSLKRLHKSKALSNLQHYNYKKFCKRFSTSNPARIFWLESDFVRKFEIRDAMTRALLETDYTKSKNEKWTTSTVVSFIHLYLESLRVDANEEITNDLLSERFNVGKTKINTYISTFINLKQNHYNLKQYFTCYELVFLKYRNPKTLAKNLNENKIPSNELQLLDEMGYINVNRR